MVNRGSTRYTVQSTCMRGEGTTSTPAMSTTLLFAALISCNAAVWNPFSSLKVPLRPPIAPLVPPSLRDGGLHKPHKIALSWRESSPLGCPYGADVSLPLCGSVYELTCVADEKTSGSPRDPYIVGNIILCDTSSIKVAALWNPEVETEGFPKFQDSREDDPREYDRLCRAGMPFKTWLRSLLPQKNGGDGREGAARLGGIDRLPGLPTPVVVCNGLQSNFVAPYDFVVADGKVVRQRYAAVQRPFDQNGTWVWVMQLQGPGGPKVVSVCVGEGDAILGQARDALIPDGLMAVRECEETDRRRHPLFAPGAEDGGVSLEACGVEEAISGIPLLLNGMTVTAGMVCRQPGMALGPNEVLWDPLTTRAAFTTVGTKDGSLVLASVTEEMTVAELAQLLHDFGVTDAILLGGSGDVSMWVTGHESHSGGEECFGGRFVFGGARKGGTRRGIFPPGERPLNCVLVAYLS